MSEPQESVLETSDEAFEKDVLARSGELPVVVDFWAPWCQPCLMLAPALEKAAADFSGRIVLVKANVDQMPVAASRFGVMSIPAVLAFRAGKIVNSFVGVLGEPAIRSFFEGLLPTEAERLAEEAKALESTDPQAAIATYRAAVAASGPLDARAAVALARFLLHQGQTAEAQALIDDLEQRGYLEPEAEAVKAQLVLNRGAADAGSVEAARQRASASPNDLHARFQLAEALAAADEHEQALAIALDLVERDRRGAGEDARKLMIAIFNLLPIDSPLAAEYRRKLSLAL